MMESTEVILVDENDNPVGTAGKMEAHEKGLRHRAFSVFIFNSKREMLLQQRAMNKYHSAGLWTNACCSHPRPGEETMAAAKRRLKEELGFVTPIKEVFDFSYKARFDNDLTENEFDHVFVGVYDGNIHFNRDEVMSIGYQDIAEINKSLLSQPYKYTAWFHIAFPEIEKWWNKEFSFSIK